MRSTSSFEELRPLDPVREPVPGQAVFDGMVDPVACCEANGAICYANPAAGRRHGRSPDELAGTRLWQLFPGAQKDELQKAFARVARSGEAEHFESHDESGNRWSENTLFQADGRVWITSRDVTVQRRAFSRLEIIARAARVFSEAATDPATLFDTIARHVADVVHDGCSIRLLSGDGQAFESPVGVWDREPHLVSFLREAPPIPSAGVLGDQLLRAGKPLVLSGQDPRVVAQRISMPDRWDRVTELGLHSMMVVALRAQGQILGLISVFRGRDGSLQPYDDADLKLLEELADCAALVASRWRTLRMMEESRQRLELIGDAVPALISLIGKGGEYQFVNAAYEKWFGRERSTILGRTLEEVLGPETYANLVPYARRALAGETVTFDARVPECNGSLARDTKVTYTPHVVEGRVEGFVALVLDVTENVQMASEREQLLAGEHRARELAEGSEERLRYVVENSPYAVAMLDRDLRYLFASGRWLTDFRLALTNESIRGRSHLEVLPEIPQHWREVYDRCLAGESAHNEAEAFPRADGTVDWLHWEIRPWMDDLGKVGGLLIFSEDVGSKKRAADDLRRWEQLFQHAGWGVVMVDPRDHRLLALNPAYASMHGYDSVEELVGQSLDAVLVPQSRVEMTAQAAASAMGHHQYESIHTRKDGSQFPCLTDVMVFTDERGRVLYRAANVQDITERKRYEAELKAAIAARDEFLSIASHELRTPLTALQLQLDSLERTLRSRGASPDDRVVAKFQTAVRQANRLTTLVDGLFNVSRISLGAFRLDLEDFDLTALVREVADQLGDQAGRAGCELQLSCPDAVVGRWDRGRIEQALTNLLANAFKYAPGKPVGVELRLDPDRLRLTVRDGGMGIALADQKRIFDRFERAVPSRHYGGLGLGLYVTKQITQAHGGSVEVESEPGKGSAFTISLPLRTSG